MANWDDIVTRQGLLVELGILRKLVATGIRNKTIPYPSKADPDVIAAVARALALPTFPSRDNAQKLLAEGRRLREETIKRLDPMRRPPDDISKL